MQIVKGYVNAGEAVELQEPFEVGSIALIGAEGIEANVGEGDKKSAFARCTFVGENGDKGIVFHVILAFESTEEEKAFVVSPVNIATYDDKTLEFYQDIISEVSKQGNNPGFSTLEFRKIDDENFSFETSVFVLPEEGEKTATKEIPVKFTMGQYLQMNAYILQVRMGNWMAPIYFNIPMFKKVCLIEATSVILDETTVIEPGARTMSSFTAYCKSVIFPTKRFCLYTGAAQKRIFRKLSSSTQEFIVKNSEIPSVNPVSIISGTADTDRNIYIIVDEYEDHCNVLKIPFDVSKRTHFLDWDKMLYL